MEKVVLALFERSGVAEWRMYRGLFNSLRAYYPVAVQNIGRKGRRYKKLVVYLKRHEWIWEEAYKLLGWAKTSTVELDLEAIEEVYRVLNELSLNLRSNKHFNTFKQTLETLGLKIFPGILADGAPLKLSNLIERFKKRLEEYKLIPEALKNAKIAKRGFLQKVRTSKILALKAAVSEETFRRDLYRLLEKGIVPLAYTRGLILSVEKRIKNRMWLSTLNENPREVLSKMTAPPGKVLVEVKELLYSDRGIGWGLVLPEWP